MSKSTCFGKIALLDTDIDVLEAFRSALEYEGFEVVSEFSQNLIYRNFAFSDFVIKYNPQVIFLDLSPFDFLGFSSIEKIRQSPCLIGRSLIITTNDKSMLRWNTSVCEGLEVLPKPTDIERLVAATERAFKSTELSRVPAA
jgi:DNA-binding response OmpR family regulator